jgi:hypothetical protein
MCDTLLHEKLRKTLRSKSKKGGNDIEEISTLGGYY